MRRAELLAQGGKSMTVSMYKVSVPIFVQLLTALSGVLDKGQAYAAEKKVDESFFLNMRLYPNMYTFARQVQQATSQSSRICAALAGVPQPDLPNTEKSFDELKDRIAKTIEFFNGLKPEQIDGTEDKVLTLGERTLTGQVHLLCRVFPHFYFHCATAYDILRHCGVVLVKRDFMGTPHPLLAT
jgi:hypothetical protein